MNKVNCSEWMCKYAFPVPNRNGPGVIWRCGYKSFMRAWIVPREVATPGGCFSSECIYNPKCDYGKFNNNGFYSEARCPLASSKDGHCCCEQDGRSRWCQYGTGRISLVPKNEFAHWCSDDDPSTRCTMDNEAFVNAHGCSKGDDWMPNLNTHMSLLPGGCPMFIRRTKEEVAELLHRIYNREWNRGLHDSLRCCGLVSSKSFRTSKPLQEMEEFSGCHIISDACKRAIAYREKEKEKKAHARAVKAVIDANK